MKGLFSLIRGFRFPIPDFRVDRKQAGAPRPNKKKANEHEPPNDCKANESLNTTQTEQTDGKECRKHLCHKTEKN